MSNERAQEYIDAGKPGDFTWTEKHDGTIDKAYLAKLDMMTRRMATRFKLGRDYSVDLYAEATIWLSVREGMWAEAAAESAIGDGGKAIMLDRVMWALTEKAKAEQVKRRRQVDAGFGDLSPSEWYDANPPMWAPQKRYTGCAAE